MLYSIINGPSSSHLWSVYERGIPQPLVHLCVVRPVERQQQPVLNPVERLLRKHQRLVLEHGVDVEAVDGQEVDVLDLLGRGGDVRGENVVEADE